MCKIYIVKFCVGKMKLFLVMDVVVWGIDIFFLDNVINYDFFLKFKFFVYRVGCVVCVGWIGILYLFVILEEMLYVFDLYLYLFKGICLVLLEEVIVVDWEKVMVDLEVVLKRGEMIFGWMF